jgi:Fe-S-cluster containining protein
MLRHIYRIVFIRWHGLLRLRPATAPVRLECLGAECGKCCNLMGGEVVVTPSEAPLLSKHLVQISQSTSVIEGNGCTCSLLVNGLCSKYDSRPKGCREYPWYNVNGALYYDAGCPGIKYDYDDRPKISTITSIENYYGILPKTIRRVVIKLMNVW